MSVFSTTDSHFNTIKFSFIFNGSSRRFGQRSQKGTGDAPFGFYTYQSTEGGNYDFRSKRKAGAPAYGAGVVVLKEQAGEVKEFGRDGVFIHGGGTNSPTPFAPNQGLYPTHACIRVLNQDIIALIGAINNHY